jgi:uncharacterized protein
MIINVRVKTRHSEAKIESFGNNRYLVYLTSEPEDNKANLELIGLLSKHFGVPHGRIKIKFGLTGQDKIVDIG